MKASPGLFFTLQRTLLPQLSKDKQLPTEPMSSMINPEQLRSVAASDITTAPLTIFYNGEMVVVPLPPHKARNIIDLAHKVEEGERGGNSLCTKTQVAAAVDSKLFALSSSFRVPNRGDDIPIARQKSLHQFLEKRKQRLTVVSPYS